VECDANISSGVMIWTAKHRHGNDSFDTVLAPVRIGGHCWVGPRSIIMPGVSVGRGAVICGGAVVTKSVPPFAIVAGIPAKVIGVRQGGVGYMLDSDYPFF
jgi:acetyltransferase-like isoleucine patch superfamily enzyme